MRFVDLEGDQWLGHVFVGRRYQGRLRETAEALPQWFPVRGIPFGEMWEDDRFWLPRILAGEVLAGDFLFRAGTLLAHRLRPLGWGAEGRSALVARDWGKIPGGPNRGEVDR
jgi:hypothetical protein